MVATLVLLSTHFSTFHNKEVALCEDLTYLQVSGGGGEHKWRISEDMENKLQREFGFVDEPVQFEPDGWMPFHVRVGRDPN